MYFISWAFYDQQQKSKVLINLTLSIYHPLLLKIYYILYSTNRKHPTIRKSGLPHQVRAMVWSLVNFSTYLFPFLYLQPCVVLF